MEDPVEVQLHKLVKIILIILTTISGAATVWFYIHRVTFDEPLFFIAEILFNIPLIFSAMMFLFLLPLTIAWTLRKKFRRDEHAWQRRKKTLL